MCSTKIKNITFLSTYVWFADHRQGPRSNFEIGGGTISDSILGGGGGAQDTFSY